MDNSVSIISGIFLLITFFSIFGVGLNEIVNKFLTSGDKVFSERFISIPLKLLLFFAQNIDSISIIILFLTLGMIYASLYDVKMTDKPTEKIYEKHKLTFGESFENDKTIIDGMEVDDASKTAIGDLFDIDLDKPIKLAKHENICDEPDPKKLKEKCKLLKNEKPCNTLNCCMWCNSKEKCVVGNKGVPLYQIDHDC